MSWTKEHSACAAADDSIDFLDESNSTRHVVMLPATKSSQEDKQWPFHSLSSSLPHIFSTLRCVQAHNSAGPLGMLTYVRLHHVGKKMEGKSHCRIVNGLRWSGKRRIGNLPS